MVKSIFKKKVLAAATFFVVSAAVVLSGFSMQNAKADTGNYAYPSTQYVKHDYTTGQNTTYTLPAIASVNYGNALAAQVMKAASVDPRQTYYDSAVVQLSLCDDFPNMPGALLQEGYATGFIIGDHEIMTAAHCVYQKKNSDSVGHYNDHIFFYIPDSNGSVLNSDGIKVKSSHVPSEYINLVEHPTNQGTQDLDYAILTVDIDLSDYGCYLLGMTTNNIKEKNVSIYSLGYGGENLKISDGNIANVGDLSYDFNLYSRQGSSGGPVYVESTFGVESTSIDEYKIKKYRTAISLIHGSNDGSNTNTNGVRIRPIIMQFAYDNDNL